METDYDEFSSFNNLLHCSNVHELGFDERCSYVRNSSECQEREFYINYIDVLYCTFKPTTHNEEILGLIPYVAMCVLMFAFLAITADKFFCPSLEVISKLLGLSEHMAGVTILAFGNGSPDLFSNFAALDEPSGPLYTNILGASIYIASFICGLICILAQFHVDGSTVVRDISFYIFGVLYLDKVVSDGLVTVLESLALIMIYVLFIICIVIDQHLVKKSVKEIKELAETEPLPAETIRRYTVLVQESTIQLHNERPRKSIFLDDEMYADDEETEREVLVKQLKNTLKPVNSIDWTTSATSGKIIMCILAPIHLTLNFLLPSVDFEADMKGWSKLLNCLQLVYMPFLTTLAVFGMDMWEIAVFSLLVTIPSSLIVFRTSRVDEAPVYHSVFAVLCAYGSMCVIYVCAAEVMEILFIVGLVFDSSVSFLGCTFMAWGNGIGDFIADCALALHGYPKMAFAACIGGPFFNTMLGMGVFMLFKNVYGDAETATLPRGDLGENCFIFLVITLFGNLAWAVTTNFKIRRCVGIFNMIIYCLFLLYACLGEAGIIQTYAEMTDLGTD